MHLLIPFYPLSVKLKCNGSKCIASLPPYISAIFCRIKLHVWWIDWIGNVSKHLPLTEKRTIGTFRFQYKHDTVFPRIIAGGDYSREGRDYFKYSSLEVVPLIVRFIFPLNETIITWNKLNMGFLRVPNLVPWIILGAWIVMTEHSEYQFPLNNESSQKDKFIWRKKRDENFLLVTRSCCNLLRDDAVCWLKLDWEQ